MKILLSIGICCLLILILTETMAQAAGYLLLSGAVVWLIILLRLEIRHRKYLIRRRTALQARWAISVRHLNGLPLPIDTPAALFFSGDLLILETEQETWTIDQAALNQILLISSELLRHINDRQLCNMLSCRERTFFALREKLRHHDSNIRRASILIFSYMPVPDKQGIWVLVSSSRPQTIAGLLQSTRLREKSLIQLTQKNLKRKPVKQQGETEI